MKEHSPNPCPSPCVIKGYYESTFILVLRNKKAKEIIKLNGNFFPWHQCKGVYFIMIVTVIMNHLPTTKIYTLHRIDLQYKQ